MAALAGAKASDSHRVRGAGFVLIVQPPQPNRTAIPAVRKAASDGLVLSRQDARSGLEKLDL